MNREQVEYAIADTAVKATIGTCRGLGKIANSKFMQSRFARNAGDFLFGATVAAIAMGSTVFASSGGTSNSGGNDGEQIFGVIEGKIGTWVQRIGGLVIVFGGVNAGIGVANQDDAGRNRGFMTMAGGAILIAVVGALNLATGSTGG